MLTHESFSNSSVTIASNSLSHNVLSADASGLHMLAVKEDGTLWAWGSDCFGEFGDG